MRQDAPPDPLADEPERHECDHGWRTVGDQYVSKILDGVLVPEERRESLRRDTVYPCRVCRADLFYRWVEGHLEPDHERRSCPECSGGESPRRRRPSRTPPAYTPPERERADLA